MSNKNLLQLCVLVIVACLLPACANKGKLRSPSQIEFDKQKKAQKAEKTALKRAKENGQQQDDDTDENNGDDATEKSAPTVPVELK